MKFNEDSRVKIPTILHLMRLGYQYLSLSEQTWDLDTNIFPELFTTAISKLNPELSSDEITRQLESLKSLLNYEDLGEAFYKKITERGTIKLIDFENFHRNSLHVVTELPCKNGDDEFRPDITLLVNGLPLVFIEVKKPNNRDGIIAEHERINTRFSNKRFRRFANITQLMIFSNNMEYDDGDPEPIQGAFYATSAYSNLTFNYFREEEQFDLTAILKSISDENELRVLKDNNLEVIRHNPEFLTNKEPHRPTNRICTSLLSPDRLAFVLRYALVYVRETFGVQKHVMRYPQIFATKAIERTLNNDVRKGIIWHTQGSGKTALTFYNVRYLTDYFQQRNIIPKFYFIVDRIDLLEQAQREFTARGLRVHVVDSREAFTKDIKSTQVIHNDAGAIEITVVNIQKFADDPHVVQSTDYNLSLQRIYFLDEVHRSYNPKGSFLANLSESDKNAIKIGLTGTPLLGDEYNSRSLFGDYIHKYYYNASIADGYTLRLIREEISTQYKLQLQQALQDAEVKMGDVDKRKIYAHPSFVTPMLDYILDDFVKSRQTLNDNSIGAMVICDSADQAKQMFEIFNDKKASTVQRIKSGALILHDIGSKQERKHWVEEFKAGKIDILFVYNMLLTGFDAKRLKKLYLGRVIRNHGLLQALTRVNRTYKDFRYGYVVDFADIRKEFDETNKAYFDELQSELGDEFEHYSSLFKSSEEIAQEIEQIKDMLFRFNTENMEEFSEQINQIADRTTIIALKKVLADARSLYNIIRTQGHYEFLGDLDFKRLNILYRETSNHLELLNLKENIENGNETANLLNRALEDVIFKFEKINEEELVIADELKNTLRQTREALQRNIDQDDPKFLTLKEELERIFKNRKLSEISQGAMKENIILLNKIHEQVKVLNRENEMLRKKYQGDEKYTRIHKRLQERHTQVGGITDSERKIAEALLGIKNEIDEKVLNNTEIINNESYFERQVRPVMFTHFEDNQKIDLTAESAKYINHLVVTEYLKQYGAYT
ncbi:type I restriction endonuclease subunit R [Thorsellia anophelis]|uniref:type I site-specific deoxyribonuclease n=1 Tax=Thorsellia anophelis DSM 18579 TaxID=1123402 RepID=A0A1I0CW41_9GAMM|nr:type I restriction endonuclease [Thorsellia anophelis]SET24054.1 type I restriction enzyme, R subunit [Thorsellia anophelis DSM 18579]